MVFFAEQWDGCTCGDCELCGGTAPIDFTPEEVVQRAAKAEADAVAVVEPLPVEPGISGEAAADAALLASLRRNVNDDIQERVAKAIAAQREVRHNGMYNH